MKKVILVLIGFVSSVTLIAEDWIGNSSLLNDLKSVWVGVIIDDEAVELLLTEEIVRAKVEIKLRLAGINIFKNNLMFRFNLSQRI